MENTKPALDEVHKKIDEIANTKYSELATKVS
jgi:hypothetical protein